VDGVSDGGPSGLGCFFFFFEWSLSKDMYFVKWIK